LYENTENTQEGQALQIWRWLICGTHFSALVCIYISENKKSTIDITNEDLLAATENILQDFVIYLIFFLPLS